MPLLLVLLSGTSPPQPGQCPSYAHTPPRGEPAPKPWKDDCEDPEELPEPLTVHHKERLPTAHATVCVTAEGTTNISKISFRLCRSQVQQNPDLQKGHPTDTTTTSARSNCWQRFHCQEQHPGATLHAAESSPTAQGHAAKGVAALPGSSLQKRPWWLQYLQ